MLIFIFVLIKQVEMKTTKANNKNKDNRIKPTIIKNEFIHTTFPIIHELSRGEITEADYLHNFLNSAIQRRNRKRGIYYVILYSCPRKPGALRELKERVTTYVVDTDSSAFQHWMETMCTGSQSFVEPNMIIGPFTNTDHPSKKTIVEIKQKLGNVRGIGERMLRMSEIAAEYHVFTFGFIPPILTSVELRKVYDILKVTHHDGIFETRSSASGSRGNHPPPGATGVSSR